ncbi:rRNA maturation RNase YbeY [Candidatus Poriferisodalis sp.]|uniref:rRNA maturation RNase YbeY n=1 Tax=Candidatus Poriferisodalis sp. TaxID=3101277 RepID=UPI003B0265E1
MSTADDRLNWLRRQVPQRASRADSGGARCAHEVLVEDRQTDVRLKASRYGELVRLVLQGERVPPGTQTAVAFVGHDEMTQLNEAHMDCTGPTDVLAFPLDLVPGPQVAPGTADGARTGDVLVGDVLVGDVVVCPAVAASNAASGIGARSGHDGSVAAEIDLLIVHGVLHLLGMDHADAAEAAAMQARETAHLRRWWRCS